MKKFYNNTLKRIASNRGLRLLALLCVLLGMSNSVWAAYNIYGSDFLELSFNDATPMEASGNVHSYSFTALGTGTERFRIYAGDKTDANYLGYSGNSTITNDKDYKLKKNGKTEFSFYVVKDTKYTIQVTYYADDNIVLRITKGGGGSTCTVSTSLLEATYDASTGNINLKGNFKTCGSKYHGFQWRKVGSQWCGETGYKDNKESNYVALGSSDVDGEKTGSFKAEEGVPYEVRSYIVTSSPWLTSDTKTVSTSSSGGNCKTLYLKPNANWVSDNARFAAYFFNNSTSTHEWLDMKAATSCSGIYYVVVPEGYPNVIFCRMDPNNSKNDWNDKGGGCWNQTNDLDISDTNNQYTVKEGAWSKGDGSWSVSSCTDTDCAPDVVISGNVLLTYEATYNYDESTSTGTAKLYGYYKQNPIQDGNECINVTDYGFAFCSGVGCTPSTITTLGSDYVQADNVAPDAIVERGQSFTSTTTKLPTGTVVGYRAYAMVNGIPTFSSEIRYLSTGGCIPQPGGGDTIRVVVDAETYFNSDTTKIDNCALRYGNLSRALTELKANKEYVDASGNLLQPIIITVANMPKSFTTTVKCEDFDGDGELDEKEMAGIYKGVNRAVSGGDNGTSINLNVLAIEGFNKNKETGYHPLIIRAKEGHNPRLQHILIRSSRGVVLDGFQILSNPDNCGSTEDTALEMDNGRSTDWHNTHSKLGQAGIVIKNCMIGSNGFTGTHISDYDGITFENNIFNLSTKDISNNAALWGASAKFIECKNIKFVRNNLMGEHGTLIWLQETQNVLIYNNVFWNTNQYNAKCMAIGVYNQFGHQQPDNVACIYNTFYLADNDANKNDYDFFTAIYANGNRGNTNNITGQMTFMYNNCYSFDKDIPGSAGGNIGSFTGTKNFCPNNFWSVPEKNKTSSAFSFYDCGDNTKFINVANLLCESTASSPAQLVVRQPAEGAGLKVGKSLDASKVSGYCGDEIELTDIELTHDRNHLNVRTGSTWTLGAFEASAGNTVNTIYWTGGLSDDWDDRGNWYWRDANNSDHMLTCVDFLPTDVKIVIPEQNSTKYPTASSGKYFIATIPDDFSAAARTQNGSKKIPASEQVTAGKGLVDDENLTGYASSIELEYGASLKGVENLIDGGNSRYVNAITSMTLDRDQWTLVGPVVKPFANGKDGNVREVISGDYFLNYEPNVYMHEAVVGQDNEGNPTLTWNKSFPNLNVEVLANTAFAVSIPNSYGNWNGIGFPADVYYNIFAPDARPNHPMIADATLPKSFKPFNGRFVNEDELPTYTFDGSGSAVLLNNSYPCNIDVEKLEGEGDSNGTVYLYDYEAGSIKVASEQNAFTYKGYAGKIKPQNGFVFKPKPGVTEIKVTKDMLTGGNTRSRAAMIEQPTLSINLHAGSSNSKIHSTITIKQDEVLGEGEESQMNAPTVFAYREAPEMYMVAHDKKLSRLIVSSGEQMIPLGIQVNSPMYVTFKVTKNSGYKKAILVDTYTGLEHDLLKRAYTADILAKGVCDGRYYLNVSLKNDKPEEEEDNNDEDVSTTVDEATNNYAINIYQNTKGDNIINIVTSSVELQSILISDLKGHVVEHKVSGNYARIRVQGNTGIYIVKVVGDKLTRTEKVIIK